MNAVQRLTTGPPVVLLLGLLGVFIGLSVAVMPPIGLLLAGGVMGILLLSFTKSMAHATLIIYGASGLISAASGPISSGAVLTVAIAGGSWLAWILLHQRGEARFPLALAPFVALVGWGTMTTVILYQPNVLGIQNLFVLFAFLGAAALSASLAMRMPDYAASLERSIHIATALGVGTYMASALIPGMSRLYPAGGRSFALFALIMLAWYIARWRHGSFTSLIVTFVILGAIGFSLSRTALAAGIILFAIALARPRGVAGLLRLLLMLAVTGVVGYMIIQRVEPLRQRFFEGDLAIEVYGVKINAMGRVDMWQATLDSFEESPIFGKGVGSIQALIGERFPGLDHPHNDYLRLLHDYGIIGFALWMFGFAALIYLTWAAWQRADRMDDDDGMLASVHLAAFLGLLALGGAMLTDNVMVYAWVLAPLGVFVGASLGYAARAVRTAPSPHLEPAAALQD